MTNNCCLTLDLDWASDAAIEYTMSVLSDYGVPRTVFVTHWSDCLDEGLNAELGWHPNFLPGSTHGKTVSEVIRHMAELLPNAVSYRSHCFYDDTRTAFELARAGMRYDANLCLYLQDGLVPLQHATGLLRYPTFWEDDIHWLRHGSWDFRKYEGIFGSQGLKVINIHPFIFALNCPSEAFYLSVKSHIPTLTASEIRSLRYDGPGAQTFVLEMLDAMRGRAWQTLSELYADHTAA